MDERDVLLEIRKADAGFEVRLRRGNDLGEEPTFEPLALPAALWQQAGALRPDDARGDLQAQREHGVALLGALPAGVATRLAGLVVPRLAPGEIRRVVLQLPDGIPHSEPDPADLAWECMLRSPCAVQRLHDAEATDLAAREPLLVPPLRVLLVLTGLEDPAHRIVREAQRLVTDLCDALGNQKASVDLRVAASELYVVTDADGRPRLTGGGKPTVPAPVVQDVYRDVASFRRLLQNGRLDRDASGKPASAPPHVVVLFGHSNAKGAMQATALRLGLFEDDARTEIVVADGDVRDSLAARGELALVVAIPCSSGGIARRLLSVAPHVVGMQGLTEPVDRSAPLGRLLCELALGRRNRVHDAVEAARAAAIQPRRFQIQHVSSQRNSAVFVARHERALDEYHRELSERHGRIRPRHGAGLRVGLLDIHVAIQFQVVGSAPGVVEFEALLRPQRGLWMLGGGPGTGKTTTLLSFALQARPKSLLLSVQMHNWLEESSGIDNRFESIVDSLERHIGIRELAQALHIREQARKRLGRLASTWKLCTFLVACRESAREDEFGDGWRSVDVCELSHGQQVELVERGFRIAREERGTGAALDARTLLAEIAECNGTLASNPLLLTILASRALFQRDAPAPRSQLDVLVEMIGDLLAHRYDDALPYTPELPVVPVRKLLASIAWTMTEAGTLVADTTALTAAIQGDEDAKELVRATGTDEWGLLDRMRITGLLLRRKGEARWHFAHRYLQDALTAEYRWQSTLSASRDPVPVVRMHLAARAQSASLKMWTQPAPLVSSRIERRDEVLNDLAERLIAQGSKRTALSVLSHAGDWRRSTQLRALVLGRSAVTSEVGEGERLLGSLRADGALDAETYGILAGIKKRRFVDGVIRRRGDADAESLRQARELYAEGFAHPDCGSSYYLGVNALATTVWEQHWTGTTHDVEALLRRVRAALAAVPEDRRDHWYLATLAEVEPLNGELDVARGRCREAVAASPRKLLHHATMRRQARVNLVALGKCRGEFGGAFDIGRVAAFTGHLIDRPGRFPERFPARFERTVAARLRKLLDPRDVRLAFSQAADGGDLLFIEGLLARGGQPRVILPFPPADFVRASVLPEWRARFHGVPDDARVRVEVLGPLPADEGGQSDAYRRCNERLTAAPYAEAHDLVDDPLLVCVWGRSSGKVGGTGEMVAKWTQDDCTIDVIEPSIDRGGIAVEGGTAVEWESRTGYIVGRGNSWTGRVVRSRRAGRRPRRSTSGFRARRCHGSSARSPSSLPRRDAGMPAKRCSGCRRSIGQSHSGPGRTSGWSWGACSSAPSSDCSVSGRGSPFP
ncbi:MAG: hypothetical protein IPM29_08360 [Planctomycetes bacterium]|nr:hypothetical protein [Planctomycetota bacterium]